MSNDRSRFGHKIPMLQKTKITHVIICVGYFITLLCVTHVFCNLEARPTFLVDLSYAIKLSK